MRKLSNKGGSMNRFWAKVDTSGECWEWTACRSAQGYGRFKFEDKTRKAHRMVWGWFFGEIPEGKQVLHKCDNPPCVNPFHLFLGTNSDNMKDRDEKGRGWQVNKTHCPSGHPYAGANLYINSKGWRYCRECARLRKIKNVKTGS